MKSSAVKPGYNTMAICMVVSSSGEGLAVVVRRDAHPSNEVAPHGFCSAEPAPRCDHGDGVVGLLELPAGRLVAHADHPAGVGCDGLDPFDESGILSRRPCAETAGQHDGVDRLSGIGQRLRDE